MIQVRSGALECRGAHRQGSRRRLAGAVDHPEHGSSGGIKLSCIASPMNKIPRTVGLRKEITSVEDLRGWVVGVQSIGGGFWLQTMIILDSLGVDPDKFGLKFASSATDRDRASADHRQHRCRSDDLSLSEHRKAGFRSLGRCGD